MWRRISILIIVAGFSIQGAWGQSRANSPYSIFGLGDMYTSGYLQYPEYGGSATGYMKRNRINFANPAAYRAIDSMRFVLDFGFTNNNKFMEDQNTSQTANDFNFTYYAFGFRVTPWWHASVGLMPVSNRNYFIGLNNTDNEIYNETYYVGSGNLNKVYLGQSFSIIENLSVGLNLTYLFGEHIETKTILFPDAPFMRNTQESYKKQIQDFGLETGIMYTKPLGNFRSLHIGATYTPLQNIDFKEDFILGATTGENLQDPANNIIKDTTSFYEEDARTFKLPQSFSIGASLTDPRKYTASVSFDYSMWGSTVNPNLEDRLTSLQNSFRISGGYSFIPKWNSATSYFHRASYVFGAFFEQQYMDVNGKNINGFALSLGFGAPIRRVGAKINVGVELGQRGTLKENLIRENYIKVNLKFNFSEIWFFERKYD